jgi:phage baseplate assembly protein W
LPDLGDRFVLKSGNANLAEAIARRLMTPRGGLFYDQTYGIDLRAFLNEAITDARLRQIESEAAAEATKDPRVEGATATAALVNDRLTLSLELETGAGPFPLVLAVSDLTVEILRAG